ncbi:hypothetical protein NBRC116602_16260 [Hyphomicrobiales bacterium 4NK60-0047b]|jgi:hypothetical protein
MAITTQTKEINNLFSFDQEKVDTIYISQPMGVVELGMTTYNSKYL